MVEMLIYTLAEGTAFKVTFIAVLFTGMQLTPAIPEMRTQLGVVENAMETGMFMMK